MHSGVVGQVHIAGEPQTRAIARSDLRQERAPSCPGIDTIDTKLDPSPVYPDLFIDFSYGDQISGLAVDSRGDIFVASGGDNAIKQYSPTRSFIRNFASIATPLHMAFDMDDNLYVTSRYGS